MGQIVHLKLFKKTINVSFRMSTSVYIFRENLNREKYHFANSNSSFGIITPVCRKKTDIFKKRINHLIFKFELENQTSLMTNNQVFWYETFWNYSYLLLYYAGYIESHTWKKKQIIKKIIQLKCFEKEKTWLIFFK